MARPDMERACELAALSSAQRGSRIAGDYRDLTSLVDVVRMLTGISRSKLVSFKEHEGSERVSEDSDGAAEGLVSRRTMILFARR